ncbi:hypothetical protein EVAR_86864_1 [Eumeta japonica]|uniref:Uncharacterized protein n=1 Tax=Eumeta variegata TaxID=151549 RepID=A0A4C1VT64_EUMVA|nr:hypothetical protein EVAR_86864_1 [Eumeta japonica]
MRKECIFTLTRSTRSQNAANASHQRPIEDSKPDRPSALSILKVSVSKEISNKWISCFARARAQGVHTSGATRGDGSMQALAAAAALVPYDSALFVVTDAPAADAHRLPSALKALVEKRLKVYTIWTDPLVNAPETESALADFRKISRHTEGDVLPYALQVMNMNAARLASELGDWGMDTARARGARLNANIDNEQLETLLVRRGGGDASSLGIPVETGVKALRVLIEGAVEHAVLYPPNDGHPTQRQMDKLVNYFTDFSPPDRSIQRELHTTVLPQIKNLLPEPEGHGADIPRSHVRRGVPIPDTVMATANKWASIWDYLLAKLLIIDSTVGDSDRPDIDLRRLQRLSVLPAGTTHPAIREPTAGTWHLSVRCDTCDYRLTVRAKALISADASLLPEHGDRGGSRTVGRHPTTLGEKLPYRMQRAMAVRWLRTTPRKPNGNGFDADRRVNCRPMGLFIRIASSSSVRVSESKSIDAKCWHRDGDEGRQWLPTSPDQSRRTLAQQCTRGRYSTPMRKKLSLLAQIRRGLMRTGANHKGCSIVSRSFGRSAGDLKSVECASRGTLTVTCPTYFMLRCPWSSYVSTFSRDYKSGPSSPSMRRRASFAETKESLFVKPNSLRLSNYECDLFNIRDHRFITTYIRYVKRVGHYGNVEDLKDIWPKYNSKQATL